MRDYLKKYDAKLIVTGPVFIGSGKEISKKEYIFMPGRKIGVVDIGRLSVYTKKKGLQRQFEEFLLNENRLDLKNWTEQYSINLESVPYCLKYTIDMGDTVLQRGTRVRVMECIKDPYGLPYIPGSSIKGMLRTIILTSELNSGKYSKSEENTRRGVRNEKKKSKKAYLSREIKGTEAEVLNTLNRNPDKTEDAVNDVLSGMVVSDSDPIGLESLVLCQKIDRHIDKTEKRLNLLREGLIPGTEIKFTITIDESVMHMDSNGLLSAIRDFNTIYNENFLAKFQGMNLPPNDTVYLGGGAGFVSKTVIYSIFGEEGVRLIPEIYRNTGVPENHRHDRDVKLGVAPHTVKCTHYKGKSLHFGECRLVI